MNRAIALLIIGLAFGGLGGFLLAAANGVTLDGHDHSEHVAGHGDSAHDASTHDHTEMLSLPAGPDAPTLNIALTPDPDSGWNLHVMTTGFTFAPQNASRKHVPGEGHAHIYVDGVKHSRLYGPWAHLASLPAGATVEVTLTTNDHRTLAVEDSPLTATATVPAS